MICLDFNVFNLLLTLIYVVIVCGLVYLALEWLRKAGERKGRNNDMKNVAVFLLYVLGCLGKLVLTLFAGVFFVVAVSILESVNFCWRGARRILKILKNETRLNNK